MNKFAVRIETTAPTKGILPWVAVARRGKQSVDTQLFALIGYPERQLAKLTPRESEEARDALEFALRLTTAFEYIPNHEEQVEDFFEKKLLQFERKINNNSHSRLQLHAVLGIVVNSKIYFASSGDILVLQITPSAIANLAGGSVNSSFHFDTFQAGNLSQNSCLLLVPKTISSFLKSDELKGLPLARASARKLDYIERVWMNRSTIDTPLRAIILDAKPKAERASEATAVSIANLLGTEAKTEELLSPPILRPFFKTLRSLGVQSLRAIKHTAHALKNKKDRAPDVSQAQNKERARTLGYSKPLHSYFTLSNYLRRSVERFKKLPQTTRVRKEKTRAHLSEALTRSVGTLRTRISDLSGANLLLARFNVLPYKSKLVVLLILLLAFLLTQGILITRHSRMVANAQSLLAGEVKTIAELIAASSASLIYNDEVGARRQLDEARAHILTLSDLNEDLKQRFGARVMRSLTKGHNYSEDSTRLAVSVEEIEEQLRHAVVIDNPQFIEGDQAIDLDLDIAPPNQATYSNRLYTLEPAQNQIIRYEKNPDGPDRAISWLKDTTDITDGISLTIDGFIYVLHADGRVTKFLRGARQNFELKPIDPELKSGVKIWTDENSDYLYILDPVQNRLLAFNKNDGLLKVQYSSPVFTNLKDMKIDEGAKMAYLINGEEVLSISLSHL